MKSLGFRLGLKGAYKSLDEKDQEDFLNDVMALHFIDPFKYVFYVFLACFLVAVSGWRWGLLVVLGVYLVWVLLYFIAFVGVYLQFQEKKRLDSEVFRRVREFRSKKSSKSSK